MSLTIKKKSNDVFVVTVCKSETTVHTVTVTNKMLNDLTKNRISKESLLEFSFHFLLDREPNTLILSSFDIIVISKYFSDYQNEVRKWCDES
tara:strand:+ start:1285 stop:1560 length:276 start_codon:yes stop_codon:yes gene_type:complete